jgi:pectate lyase
MTLRSIINFILCNTLIISAISAQQLAFPTAEGYGRFAQGGRGGDVYHVTNLNDAGPGSFRAGIETASGPRTIVFDVSGTIELESDFVIGKSYITIAGQTAPGDGITLKNHTFRLENANHIIVRYLRIRFGDKNKSPQMQSGLDAITTNDIDHVIFDHLSVSWGIDAAQDMADGSNFTLQWSMYGESLNNSLHRDHHPHAMLSSFRHLKGNITLHHNLFFSSRDRHPTLGGGDRTMAASIVDFRNNVIFNRRMSTNFGNCNMNIINNYYRPGSSYTLEFPTPFKVKGEYAKTKTRGYLKGNFIENNMAFTRDNYTAVSYTMGGKYQSISRELFELSAEVVSDADKPETQSAQQAYTLVLAHAGASKARDAADRRIIRGIKDRTNRLIDSQDEVGGWPLLRSIPPAPDTDRDGMPDAWEKANGFDPDDPRDRNGDIDKDGYTNLEEYLNELVK